MTIVVFDIDGVVRDVSGSYRRALADTVEHFTHGAYRPSSEQIDALKGEGSWNNDWEASQELIYRYFEEQGKPRETVGKQYEAIVAFFQSRYRGPDPTHWTGYICQEPLLMSPECLVQLTQAGIKWGFFSGATTGSARYVLERRLGLPSPILVAMEDAPGKPAPTGLFQTIDLLDSPPDAPVIYVGDTVADMYTIANARALQPDRAWIAVGVLPPHVLDGGERQDAYAATLKQAGATVVFHSVQDLTPVQVQMLSAAR
ncbi:MAG TPA: TIGR01548 family HAD-type hydrolase [Thermosynechococcaceae cyanobacterium]